MKPLFSIVVCVFNAEETLADALQSVRNQTFTDFEVIVVNDGSTDNTQEIISSFLGDERVKTVYQKNEGLGASRNLGIALTEGKWVCFLDADDFWLPRRLEILANFIRSNSDADWFYHPIFEKHKNGLLRQRNFWAVHTIQDLVSYGNPFVPSAVTLNRSVLQKTNLFDSSRNLVDDLGLWFLLLHNGVKNVAIYQPLTIYAVGEGMSAQIEVYQQKIRLTLESLQQNSLISGSQKQTMLQRNVYETARHFHKLGNFAAAQTYYQKLSQVDFKTKILTFLNRWEIVV